MSAAALPPSVKRFELSRGPLKIFALTQGSSDAWYAAVIIGVVGFPAFPM